MCQQHLTNIYELHILETALWLGPGFAGKKHLFVLTFAQMPLKSFCLFCLIFHVNPNRLVFEEMSVMCLSLFYMLVKLVFYTLVMVKLCCVIL